jgi:hypothetical protein
MFRQTSGFWSTIRLAGTIVGGGGYFMLCGKFRIIFPTLGLILDCIAAFLTTSAVGYAVGSGLVAAEHYVPPWLRKLIANSFKAPK